MIVLSLNHFTISLLSFLLFFFYQYNDTISIFYHLSYSGFTISFMYSNIPICVDDVLYNLNFIFLFIKPTRHKYILPNFYLRSILSYLKTFKITIISSARSLIKKNVYFVVLFSGSIIFFFINFISWIFQKKIVILFCNGVKSLCKFPYIFFFLHPINWCFFPPSFWSLNQFSVVLSIVVYPVAQCNFFNISPLKFFLCIL